VVFFRGLQTELARDLGYAAARFGHVMFPENVYEPALKCAELLLEGVGKGLYFFFFLSFFFSSSFFFPLFEIIASGVFDRNFQNFGLSHVIS
jgi:hypothetical protein